MQIQSNNKKGNAENSQDMPVVQAKAQQDLATQAKQGQLSAIQTKHQPVQRSQGYKPHQARQKPIQRKTQSKAESISQSMGEQYGVDTSKLQFNHNSSFPKSVGAEATIQGNKIDFAPGKDTETNIKHEVGHAIDNAKNGTPKGDRVVNGQVVDTTREAAADKMMNTPLQRKASDTTSDLSQHNGTTNQVLQLKTADGLFKGPNIPHKKINADIRLVKGIFKGYGYMVPLQGVAKDKSEAIQAAAQFIGTTKVSAGSSSKFMSMKNVWRLAGGSKQGIDRNGKTPSTVNGGDKNVIKNKLEPYTVSLQSKYRSIQGVQSLAIRYNFAQESYGYVTAIIDEGVYSEMVPGGITRGDSRSLDYDAMRGARGHNEDNGGRNNRADYGNKGMDDAHIYNAFDQNHEKTGGRNLMDIIKQHPSDQSKKSSKEKLTEHREHFDSIAKLAGEGPRFQCVRNNVKKLSSNTRFITPHDGGFITITFEDLAAHWRELKNAYNIPDKDVIAMMKLYYDKYKNTSLDLVPKKQKKYKRSITFSPNQGGHDILLRP
ncbi:hypothetical protein [uncultured Microscilla sp.]|uniref:hypothetical protein n=1 Tax=uncultured Microscilla sp. TaxID=432653 RepID=UPI00262815CB|nr:hypothetical protein [uncultured Microscilla sp.]